MLGPSKPTGTAGIGWQSRHCSVDDCVRRDPQFHCYSWVGGHAATTPTGDQWIVPSDLECPPGRDTATYLSMDAVTRLACAGEDEWRLIAVYRGPGRAGLHAGLERRPVLDGPLMLLLLPAASRARARRDTSLQGFIGPELGEDAAGACPWDDLTGSWAEVVGHLDDPVAESCTYVLNSPDRRGAVAPTRPGLGGVRVPDELRRDGTHGNDAAGVLARLPAAGPEGTHPKVAQSNLGSAAIGQRCLRSWRRVSSWSSSRSQTRTDGCRARALPAGRVDHRHAGAWPDLVRHQAKARRASRPSVIEELDQLMALRDEDSISPEEHKRRVEEVIGGRASNR